MGAFGGKIERLLAIGGDGTIASRKMIQNPTALNRW